MHETTLIVLLVVVYIIALLGMVFGTYVFDRQNNIVDWNSINFAKLNDFGKIPATQLEVLSSHIGDFHDSVDLRITHHTDVPNGIAALDSDGNLPTRYTNSFARVVSLEELSARFDNLFENYETRLATQSALLLSVEARLLSLTNS
jgi:hypothetical protein